MNFVALQVPLRLVNSMDRRLERLPFAPRMDWHLNACVLQDLQRVPRPHHRYNRRPEIREWKVRHPQIDERPPAFAGISV
jgi:hypothetical protein